MTGFSTASLCDYSEDIEMEEGDLFLNSYDGQTVDELIDLQSTHRIDSIVLAFEASLDSRKEAGEKLTDVELIVLAIEAFDREVNNGGFSQFFYNSSVEYAPIIVNSLKAIGCDKLSELAQKSIDIVAVDVDVDVSNAEAVEDRMDPDDEDLEEALGELDDIFYDSEEIPAYALFDFIKNNRKNIRLGDERIQYA